MVCVVFLALGFTYMHFAKKHEMTWFTPQDSYGQKITATEQIVNQTQANDDITVYLRAIYYQNDSLYLSFSTGGRGKGFNDKSFEIYFNNEVISSSSGGGQNRVKDTIYWGLEIPLSKHLNSGDKITAWIVKSDREKTNLKFDLVLK